MKISVSGKGVDIGEAFSTHAQERIESGVTKYIDRVNMIDVVASKRGHEFTININGNTGTSSGIIIKSTARANDIYAALDAAAEKIEKQLRRYKRRLTDHHRRQDGSVAQVLQGKKYVIESDAGKEEEDSSDAPVVVAEKLTHISTLTVSEAVMRMDLAELPALMFHNAANGRLNVVYKRADGNISWVDPAEESSEKAA
jgi:ribosomal subunit interface protein